MVDGCAQQERDGGMACGFPLYIDLHGNNCVIIGGGDYAAFCARTLLRFGAKVTVICPLLSPALKELDDNGAIRHIPRRYYRGDCTNSCLCIAATDSETVNIAVSDECKAKGIPVNLSKPAAFGNFFFPAAIVLDDMTVSVAGERPTKELLALRDRIEAALPDLLGDGVPAET
jgi:siroheme synthase, N-terminal domain